MTTPLILITNDDGIQAEGLHHLSEAVSSFADVAICAPSMERSGSGASMTWATPLQILPVSWKNNTPAWSVSGTPVDCVKLALSVLLPKKPTLVLSGINRGSNEGRTIFYSGTVGGVIEGTLQEIPGIAFSFSDFFFPPLSSVKELIISIVQYSLQHPMRTGSLLNVNFPLNCEKGTKGIRMAKQGQGYWTDSPEKRLHPTGSPYYWLGGKWAPFEEDPESDVSLLRKGYTTVAPLFIGDITDSITFQAEKSKLEKFAQASIFS